MAVRSDNGGEFREGAFGALCRKRGIKQEFTTPDGPQFNGVAERGMALLDTASLAARIQAPVLYPKAPTGASLWAESVNWACHVLNRTSTTANPGDKSPFEMWHGYPANTAETWPFLKPLYYKAKRENKSQPKAQEGYYLGPAINHASDAMRVISNKQTILTTRNVTWQHVPHVPTASLQQLPPINEVGESAAEAGGGEEGTSSQGGGGKEYLDNNLDVTRGPGLAVQTRVALAAKPRDGTTDSVVAGTIVSSKEGAGSAPPTPSVSGRDDISSGGAVPAGTSGGGPSSNSSDSSSSSDSSNSGSSGGGGHEPPVLAGKAAYPLLTWQAPTGLERGRTRKQSQAYEMNESTTAALLSAATEVATAEFASTSADNLSAENWDDRIADEQDWLWENEICESLEEHRKARLPGLVDDGSTVAMVTQLSTPIGLKPIDVEPIPHSVAGVEQSEYKEGWKKAMAVELDGHEKTGTFVVAELPKGRKAVGSRWVFNFKTDKDGNIVKFKARLVAKGFSQIRNVDYTFSPSPCPSSTSIKLITAVANENGLSIFHFDVAQAYIRAKLDEEVFMRLPGVCGDKSGKIVRLKRSLYGLKQSRRQWANLLAETLVKYGLEQCKADPCVFRKVVARRVEMIVGVYVDDIMVAGSIEACGRLHVGLNKEFPTNDLGELTYYRQVVRSSETGSWGPSRYRRVHT